MILAARTMGSMVACGAAPCPPLPLTRISMESTFAHAIPSRTAMVPAGLAASQCKAMQKSGLGKSLNNPSSSIAFAPAPISSAG